MKEYSFGVPRVAVWISHFIIGAFLIYVGYLNLNEQHLPQMISVSLIVLGALAALYHAHIWFNHLRS